MKTTLKFAILVAILIAMLAFVSCSFSGCDFNAHKHNIVVDEAVAATCKTAGLTEGKHCSDCGEIIVPQELVIPQHNFVQNVETQLFSCGECGATIYNGHLYAVYETPMSWFEGYKLCDSLGGHLVTITSQKEQDFINGLIENAKYPEQTGSRYLFWTGGIYNGQWKWTTGEPMEYTNWGSKEPDNVGVSSYQWFIALSSKIIESDNNHLNVGDWDERNHYTDSLYGIICEWELDIQESTHYFSEWETTVEANCFIDGEETRQCTHCGLVETKKINMVEHNFIFNEAKGVTSCEHCSAAKYNGHIYMVFTQKMTWFDAYVKCEEIGGHLVTITSDNEQTFIENYMRSISLDKRAWLGAYTDGENWQWITGEPFEYSKWYAKMPDCSNGVEYFAHINYTTLGYWNDVSYNNSDISAYICEWDAE